MAPGDPKPGKIPVLVLFGPTASGKTAILDELFTPKNLKNHEFNAEIISADSMQVYRGMDIGTAKPPPETRAKIRHHLIDIKDPKEQFNAGEFVHLAQNAILSAAENRALPVVSGGTGFYIRNLIMGLPEAPPSDLSIRSALKKELAEKGAAVLMDELARKDPVSASRIHPNDEYRLLRALEVTRQTGQPLSSFAQNTDRGDSQFGFLVIGLMRGREELYRRINERCAQMFSDGLAGEVRGFFENGYTPEDPGMKAIGYREFFIENPGAGAGEKYSFTTDLAGAQALVAQNSRRYAKRQLVFFKSLPDVTWIAEPDPKKAAEEIREKLGIFLQQNPINEAF